MGDCDCPVLNPIVDSLSGQIYKWPAAGPAGDVSQSRMQLSTSLDICLQAVTSPLAGFVSLRTRAALISGWRPTNIWIDVVDPLSPSYAILLWDAFPKKQPSTHATSMSPCLVPLHQGLHIRQRGDVGNSAILGRGPQISPTFIPRLILLIFQVARRLDKSFNEMVVPHCAKEG